MTFTAEPRPVQQKESEMTLVTSRDYRSKLATLALCSAPLALFGCSTSEPTEAASVSVSTQAVTAAPTCGYAVSADTRFVQDGPARDGWQRPPRGGGPGRGAAPAPGARGRGESTPEETEPVIGLPGGPPTTTPGRGR